MAKTIRTLALAGLIGAASLTVAAPASAEDFNGQYFLKVRGMDPTAWVVRPCDGAANPGPSHCVRITDGGSAESAPFEADAFWAVGYWTMKVQRPDAIVCDDGAAVPGFVTYSWDATSLEGQLGFSYDGSCEGTEAGSLSAPFRLSREAPAPEAEGEDEFAGEEYPQEEAVEEAPAEESTGEEAATDESGGEASAEALAE